MLEGIYDLQEKIVVIEILGNFERNIHSKKITSQTIKNEIFDFFHQSNPKPSLFETTGKKDVLYNL